MNNQIIEILKSKQHNLHYLNRYIKFIDSCKIKNNDLPLETYFETHHILPKSKELFYEYKDLRQHKWNSIKLTARQHIIAHIILWKVYGGTQLLSVQMMLGDFTSNNMKMIGRTIPEAIKVRYWSSLKKERQGKGIYKDSNSNKFLLHKDDPKIQELGLVGNISGYKFSDETKQIMSFRKKHLKLYFLNFETSIKIDDPNFYNNLYEYESQGWTTEKTEYDKEYCNNIAWVNRKKVHKDNSKRLKGKMRYTDQSGVFVGWFYKDDPEINQQNLKVQWTENNKNQIKERLKKATEAKMGSKTYNNGMEEIKRKEHPGEGWTPGRLPRSEEHYQNQSNSIRKVRQGKIVYNDGVKNFYIDPKTIPESHWIKGMKPRVKL